MNQNIVDVNIRDTRNYPIKTQLDPRFRLDEPLSNQGAHSTVRLACFEGNCNYVAKVISTEYEPHNSDCYTGKDITRNEMIITEHMSRVGIAPSIYDMTLSDEEGIVVMNKYDGTLADLMYLYQTDKSIPMKDILNLVGQMLQKIHQEGVFHRDFLPTNIFYTRGGLFAVGDFGSAVYSDLEVLREVDRDYLAGIIRVFQDIDAGQRFENADEIMLASIPEQANYPIRFLWNGEECSDWQ